MRSEQPSFTDVDVTDVEYGNRRRVSRREQFLEMMDATIPWAVWVELITSYYYRDAKGKRGRRAKPVETMLRMYLLQVWFSLSDEGVEDAVYDSYAMRRFMGLDFTVEQVPDATIIAAPSSTKNATGTRDPEMHQTRKGVLKTMVEHDRAIESRKTSVRAKVEHPFLIVKQDFAFAKTRYRGLAKNLNQLHVLFASADWLMRARAVTLTR